MFSLNKETSDANSCGLCAGEPSFDLLGSSCNIRRCGYPANQRTLTKQSSNTTSLDRPADLPCPAVYGALLVFFFFTYLFRFSSEHESRSILHFLSNFYILVFTLLCLIQAYLDRSFVSRDSHLYFYRINVTSASQGLLFESVAKT